MAPLESGEATTDDVKPNVLGLTTGIGSFSTVSSSLQCEHLHAISPTLETKADVEGGSADVNVDDSLSNDGLPAALPMQRGESNAGSCSGTSSGKLSKSNSIRVSVISATSLIADNLTDVLWFLWAITIRLLPTMVLLWGFGYFSGMAMNRAADFLLKEAEVSGWTQVWRDDRSLILEDARLMNQTYVRPYDSRYRDDSLDPDAPKLSNAWIILFYVRLGVAAAFGYIGPWLWLIFMHGWPHVKKYFVLLYGVVFLFVTAYTITTAYWNVVHGTVLVPTEVEYILGFALSAVQIFVVIPFTARRISVGLGHVWKTVIFPFLMLNLALFLLKIIIPPLMAEFFETDLAKVCFRLTGYVILQECFVGSARIFARLVPLVDADEIRPEDKPAIVLPVVALFGYWGRILIMGLRETYAIWLATVGLAVLEFLSRVYVVERDKIYLSVLFRSKTKQADYWKENAPAMKRLRSSMVYNHMAMEYLMIASACAFYYASGIATDAYAHFYNTCVQILGEIITDGASLYVEVVKVKLPVVTAWNNRRANWTFFYGLFLIVVNVIALSHSGQEYCALRSLKHPDSVIMTYCGPTK